MTESASLRTPRRSGLPTRYEASGARRTRWLKLIVAAEHACGSSAAQASCQPPPDWFRRREYIPEQITGVFSSRSTCHLFPPYLYSPTVTTTAEPWSGRGKHRPTPWATYTHGIPLHDGMPDQPTRRPSPPQQSRGAFRGSAATTDEITSSANVGPWTLLLAYCC